MRRTAPASTSPPTVSWACREHPDPGLPGRPVTSVHAGSRGRPDQLAELAVVGLIDGVVNVRPFRRGRSDTAGRHDEALEMIDGGLLGAAARNAAGVAAAAGALPARDRRAEGAGSVVPSFAQLRLTPRRCGRLPRRDRRVPQPVLREHLPEAPGDGPREGGRPRYGENPTRRLLTARRRTAPGRLPTPRSSRATGRRSTTCSTRCRLADRGDYTSPTAS
jgi:hypothetical protein